MVVRSHEDLIEAVPHVLGFKPEESLILAPISGKLPFARVDLPIDATERSQMIDAIREPYAQHGNPGDRVAIVCVTENRGAAELASRELADTLVEVGIETPMRIWSNDERWVEFNSGREGVRTDATESRVAAEVVGAARALPMQSRDALAESLVGDRGPVAALLPTARAAAERSTPADEHAWALDRIENFHSDGLRLSDADSSRLLLAMQNTGTRDAAWEAMTRENSASQVALWTDITRRAPDEVRTPAASMLGFASWLQGNGARAWCALDQVPDEQQSYPMVGIVSTALRTGTHPEVWEKGRDMGAGAEVDESFVPPARGQHPAPEIPGPGPQRSGPER